MHIVRLLTSQRVLLALLGLVGVVACTEKEPTLSILIEARGDGLPIVLGYIDAYASELSLVKVHDYDAVRSEETAFVRSYRSGGDEVAMIVHSLDSTSALRLELYDVPGVVLDGHGGFIEQYLPRLESVSNVVVTPESN